MKHPACKLIALDADGTLLDGADEITPPLSHAIGRLQQSGIRVVICTGRRFRRAADVARAAGLSGPIVCNSGALVKNAACASTLWRADLSIGLIRRVMDLFRSVGRPALSFADSGSAACDFHATGADAAHAEFLEYVRWNAPHASTNDAWPEDACAGRLPAFHLCAIGARGDMLDFQNLLQSRLGSEIRTFVQRSPRSRGWMCEILRGDAGKWSALAHLAALWNIPREAVVAIGDDHNDLPMIEGAGLGVAMAHAPSEVLERADCVLDTRPDALARFLHTLTN